MYCYTAGYGYGYILGALVQSRTPIYLQYEGSFRFSPVPPLLRRSAAAARAQHYRTKPKIPNKSQVAGILVTEVITFDK